MELKSHISYVKDLEPGASISYGGTYTTDKKIRVATIPAGYADVIVCEAFVGNVILKLYEGLGSTFTKMIKAGLMKDTRSKIGALLAKPAIKETMKAFDASEYGGAPLLGLKGLVVKTHGSAKAVEIRHAIFQCVQFRQQKINEKIAAHMVEETPEKNAE